MVHLPLAGRVGGWVVASTSVAPKARVKSRRLSSDQRQGSRPQCQATVRIPGPDTRSTPHSPDHHGFHTPIAPASLAAKAPFGDCRNETQIGSPKGCGKGTGARYTQPVLPPTRWPLAPTATPTLAGADQAQPPRPFPPHREGTVPSPPPAPIRLGRGRDRGEGKH